MGQKILSKWWHLLWAEHITEAERSVQDEFACVREELQWRRGVRTNIQPCILVSDLEGKVEKREDEMVMVDCSVLQLTKRKGKRRYILKSLPGVQKLGTRKKI